jgi:hypothetical protein
MRSTQQWTVSPGCADPDQQRGPRNACGRVLPGIHQAPDANQCWEIGLNDCPHIPREKIQKIIDKYGETHPFVRASIYGEFPEALDEGIIIPNALITPCLWRSGWQSHHFHG